MKYHQIDFLTEENEVIQEGTVDLIITSPPLDIIKYRMDTFFAAASNVLHDEGWLLIEAPDYIDLYQKFEFLGEFYNIPWWLAISCEDPYDTADDSEFHVLGGDPCESPYLALETLFPSGVREMAHRCEFCPDMISKLIEVFSETEDVVLDPFCGTGTVPGEAELLGRQGIGCDLRPYENIREEYYELPKG